MIVIAFLVTPLWRIGCVLYVKYFGIQNKFEAWRFDKIDVSEYIK